MYVIIKRVLFYVLLMKKNGQKYIFKHVDTLTG